MKHANIAIAAIAALSLVISGSLSIAAPPPAHAGSVCPVSGEGRNVGESFFAEVLMMMHLNPHPFAVQALMAWKPYEGTSACWNPLSTTMQTATSTNFNCLNPPDCTMGVQDFPDKVSGEEATARTLQLSLYDSLRAFLAAGSFQADGVHSDLDTWGSSDYDSALASRWQSDWNDRKPDNLTPPSNLSARLDSSSNVVIGWQDTTQGERGLTVWRSDGVAWSQIGKVGPNVTRFVDRSPLDGHQGFYAVCAEGSFDTTCTANAVQVAGGAAAAQAKTKIQVTSFTTPASRGGSVFVRIVTSPQAECSLSFIPGGKAKPIASTKTADRSGVVTWSWPVALEIAPGAYPVDLTCDGTLVSKTLSIQ